MVPYFYIVPCEEPMLFTSKFFLTILVCCENPYMGSRKDNNIKNTLFISLSFWGFYLANIQNKNQKDSFFSQKFTLLCETLYEAISTSLHRRSTSAPIRRFLNTATPSSSARPSLISMWLATRTLLLCTHSVTKVLVRWTPSSSGRPPWIPPTVCWSRWASRMLPKPTRSSPCSWATMWSRAESSSRLTPPTPTSTRKFYSWPYAIVPQRQCLHPAEVHEK